MFLYRVLLIILAASAATSNLSAQSVLAEGDWYKFAVKNEGVHKITYTDLVNAGINPSGINPKNIRIYGNEGGMLPQPNSAPRPFDLQETSITVVGEDDNQFNQQDYILFYAQGPDQYYYDEEQEIFVYTQNKYAKANFYFLTVSTEPGKRIAVQTDLGHDHPLINTYSDFYFVEEEHINLLHSGREWYGRLNSSGIKSIDLPFSNLAPDGSTKVYAEVMGQSLEKSTFTVSLNGNAIGTLMTDKIHDYNLPDFRYNARGKEASGVFTVANNLLEGDGIKFELKYSFNNSSISRGYYNKILVQSERQLNYNSKQLIYHTPESKNSGIATYRVTNATSNLILWDVGDTYNPYKQSYAISSSDLLYGTVGGTIKKYVLFNPAGLSPPEFIRQINNQDLKGISTPELVIITPEEFLHEAERLADFRSLHDGYAVAVVTKESVFNEFSSGRQDVSAIRDFIKHLYDQNSEGLKYVLLVGKGSYDYLDYQAKNTNYFPIYQSFNSLHPLNTYSSDDYFGFLEDGEGQWKENNEGNHTLDVSVGRLPITSVGELKNVVDKLIHYSSSERTVGSWRTKMLLVADDEDGNLHHRQSDQLAEFADTTFNYFRFNKLYLGAYDQEKTATGEKAPKAREALKDLIEKGTFIVNFTGHGGEKQWTEEEILTNDIVDNLKNIDRLPLFVTATCEFGRHDDPSYISGGERLILNPAGGGIAIVTTSRPVYSFSNFYLNKAFLKALHDNISSGTLGDIFKDTKNNSVIGVNNRNFSLLGDPSLQLAIPSYQVKLAEPGQQDTLKSLQEVYLSGQITDSDGYPVNDFNGIVEVVVSDKPVEMSTKESGNTTSFKYNEDKSFIHRGKATVSNGLFHSNFIVPQDIEHKLDEGHLYFYAWEDKGIRDAASAAAIKIGGTADGISIDSEGPEIVAYLGDTTFRNGDFIGSNTILLARLSDESGINISGRSFHGDIAAHLDGERFKLNDHFYSDLDNFTSGWLSFPMENLSGGEHVLTITATDSYNNSSSVNIRFVVADDRRLIIDKLNNYPNPALTSTSFVFTHNRAGEPLDGELVIFNSTGEKIFDLRFETAAGQVRHKITDWNCRGANQSNLEEGIYYYKVNVRSKIDGASAEKYQKLIIIN